ncbi:MAG TPA: AI-2E family transporter [Steroidobacteraceae bacterium]|nr:AI-2E family transporter [Steroidobacteraceae bacterium]
MSTQGETHQPAPERDKLARLVRSCVIVLLSAVVIFSRTIAVPALAAVLVSIALFPIVNRAARLGVPRGLASILVLVGLLGTASGIIYAVHQPLMQLASRGPELVSNGHRWISQLATSPTQPAARQTAMVQEVVSKQSEQEAVVGVLTPVAAGVTSSLVAIGTSLILSYFILTSGTGVGRAALAAVRGKEDRRAWLRICGSIRRQAAHYLQLVTAVNIVFGIVTGAVLMLLHVKDAPAYGAIAGLMNFIPIVGALLTAGVLLAGSLAEHGGISAAVLVPPAVFLMLHILESQFITPQLLGRRLLLNPLIVIAGIFVGAAAWGVGGAFLAVPILTSLKVALDTHPTARRWGQVLGRGALTDHAEHESRRARLHRRRRRSVSSGYTKAEALHRQ